MSESKIITFTGPKEGTGKTLVALNTAMLRASVHNRNALIISLDPLCRRDAADMLGIGSTLTLAELVQIKKGTEILPSKLLKGRIPLNAQGVGVLPMAQKRTDALGLSPAQILPILEILSESYDLFVDVDPFFPIQVFALDMSDAVFWVMLPQRTQVDSTLSLFKEIKNLHFSLDRFEIIVNEADLPGAILPRELERIFQSLDKKIFQYLPWEDFLPESVNLQTPIFTERPHAPWVRGLKPIAAHIQETRPLARDWSVGRLTPGGFAQAADVFWRASSGSGREESESSAADFAVPSVSLSGKTSAPDRRPSFWDELKSTIHQQVVKALETERIRVGDNPEEARGLRAKVEAIAKDLLNHEANLELSREQRSRFLTELLDEILGLGPLEDLMRDATITEIMVNRPDQVFIERGGKLFFSGKKFRDEEHIVQVIKRIVAPIGRRIDESVPMVDARLKDGSRVNAIIPPLAVSGPSLTIRRFAAKPLGPQELIRMSSVTPEILQLLEACVKLRKNILISGGTGTGKTTFLNLLSSYIPRDERIITVEDVAELKLQQEHWVRLESRPQNIEGKGEIAIRDLVRNCLRMRPDRIVVGECRGSEALDMLQAMNTGHEGSLSTIHANSPRDALNRLESMCLMAGADLPVWALREMISSAIHIILQLSRFSDGSRRLTAVTEITGREENAIQTQELFKFQQSGVDSDGKVIGEITATGHLPKFVSEFKTKGIALGPQIFQAKRPLNPP